MKKLLRFLTDHGHREHCHKVRGPEHEHWIDESYPCTCGYEEALGELVATLRADGTSAPVRAVHADWDRRYAEPRAERRSKNRRRP